MLRAAKGETGQNAATSNGQRRGLGLSARIAIGVGASVALTAAILCVAAALAMSNSARDSFEKNAAHTTSLLAQTLGGAVKFGKSDALTEQFAGLEAASGSAAARSAAFNADGAALATFPEGAFANGAPEIVATAMETGAHVASPDGLLHATPVRFGKNNDVVGVLVVGWSDAALTREVSSAVRMLGAIGVAVAALIAAAAALVMTRLLGRPLRRLTQAVGRLLAGEHCEIAGAQRRDEIGALARALGEIHAAGAAAKRIRTALDASSVMLVVADTEGRVDFANTAMKTELGDLEGEQLDAAFCARGSVSGAATTQDGGAGELDANGRRLILASKPILGSEGENQGLVLEARDVTSERMVLESVDEILAAASEGDYSRRVNAEDAEGALRLVSDKINDLVGTVETGVEAARNAVRTLADGDLSARMEGSFTGGFAALQEDLNGSVAQISDLVSSIQEAARVIGGASAKILANADTVAGRAESQAAALEETSATMSEIASATKSAAELAADANHKSQEATERAERGGAIVENSVAAMERIKTSSTRISEIITVIDGIAFQTNLLALNAAVEAARAGDAGKGFAVVASEVRTLAQRSAEAANDIKSLIQESAGHVSEGVRLVEETGGALTEIVDAATQMAGALGQISSASREQASGVQEVTAAVRDMDGITQSNAAAAEEAAASSRALRSEAERLSTLVSKFTTGGSYSEADAA